MAYTLDLRTTLLSLPVIAPKGATNIQNTFYYEGTTVPMDIWGFEKLPSVAFYNRGLLEEIVENAGFPSKLPEPEWACKAQEVQNEYGVWQCSFVCDLPTNTIVTAFWFFQDNLTGNTIAQEQHYRCGTAQDAEVIGGNIGTIQDMHFSDQGLFNTSVSNIKGCGDLIAQAGRLFSLVEGAYNTLTMVGGNSLFLMGASVLGLESVARGLLHNQTQLENITASVANLGKIRGRIEDSIIEKMSVKDDSALNTSNLKVDSLDLTKSNLRMSTGRVDNLGKVDSAALHITEGKISGHPEINESQILITDSETTTECIEATDSKIQVVNGKMNSDFILEGSFCEFTGVNFGNSE